MPFIPRQNQREVLEYTNGKMGVAAVPGSGKTQTLSYLAARLLAQGYVEDDQEILVVTLVNSAVENFSSRISGFVQEMGFIPGVGYRVRTLHGLAHDIIRERPDLAGLPNQFAIVDERESKEILNESVQTWMGSNQAFIDQYLKTDLDPGQTGKVRKSLFELLLDVAEGFIRTAKDNETLPPEIRRKLDAHQERLPLVEMGWEIYRNYQRSLGYRSAVDFNDLIRLALMTLQSDPDFLERLRRRWVYILEDEAQDSSLLQEKILSLLAGDGNWVRVGDSNQAIFETFTTASPKYLVDFLDREDVIRCQLPNSGRSTRSIIWLANRLVEWTIREHPTPALHDGALYPNYILETPPGDPQPNPPDQPGEIHLSLENRDSEAELNTVARSIKQWLDDPRHEGKTVAALVPTNIHGEKLIEQLKILKAPYLELLKSTASTREVATEIGVILSALADPTNMSKLVQVYGRLTRPDRQPILPPLLTDDLNPLDVEAYRQVRAPIQRMLSGLLAKCQQPEAYLYPHPANNWLESQLARGLAPELQQELEWFRQVITRWQQASILPVDQLVLTIAQDIYTRPADLALSHKLALMLEHSAKNHPEFTLAEFSAEINTIADNRLSGFSEEDTGFNPDDHPGKVVVTTIHKAKGLEWDRIYLLSVNSFDFPSVLPADKYRSEKWFIRDQLNLQAETLQKLTALLREDLPGIYLEEGEATRSARYDQAAERLRVLYVGITRAREELVITWNTGRHKDCQPAEALLALARDWHREVSNAAAT